MSDPLRDISVASSESLSKEAKFWVKELDLAAKREKKWRKKAEEVWKLYEGAKRAENSFNILYANTETLLPACYNQLPRPIVDRRFRDPDPIGKAAGETLQRTLSYLMDSPEQKYASFSDIIEQAVLAALVPGRGVTRFRYEPEFEDSESALGDKDEAAGEEDDTGDSGESPKERTGDESGDDAALFPETGGKKVAYETICGEDIAYDGLLMGYARRWKDTPWVAFHHAMTKEDLEVNFGEKIAEDIPTSPPGEVDEDGYKRATSDEDGEKNLGSIPTADIYEIWHKATRTVIFFGMGYDDKVIKTIDDPLQLSGFYPIPGPLIFLRKGTEQVPTPIYALYEEQAKELNLLSKRISRVANAIKVRGFYDKTIQGIEQLLTKDDNTLIPATNVPALQQGQTLDKSIWLMPIEDLMAVLKELIGAREACKATIYEITGIADLMRGDTQASETATAQTIKDRWGSLRVRRFQRYVQEYVRECLRIMGELAGNHFAPETFASVTGLDYATDEQVQQAQATMQQVQQAMMQAQQQAAMAPGQGPGGQPLPGGEPLPAQPPQLPPQLQQAAQQAQEVLGKMKWSDITATLQNDLQRGYKIDIETNSTIEATSQEDKQNMNDALTAIGTSYQSFVPAVQGGMMTMPTLKAILGATVRRFEFGKVVEDAILQMPDQPPPPPQDPAQQKQMEAQAQQLQQQQQQLQQEQLQLEQEKAKIELLKKELQMKEMLLQEKAKMKEQQTQERMTMMQEKHMMDVKSSLDQHTAQVDAKMQQDALQRDKFIQEAAMQQRVAAKEHQIRNKEAVLQHKQIVAQAKPPKGTS